MECRLVPPGAAAVLPSAAPVRASAQLAVDPFEDSTVALEDVAVVIEGLAEMLKDLRVPVQGLHDRQTDRPDISKRFLRRGLAAGGVATKVSLGIPGAICRRPPRHVESRSADIHAKR